MTSKYIPVHHRKADEFPSLGSAPPTRSWSNTKSFSSLARDWDQQTKDMNEQMRNEHEREEARMQREKLEQKMHFTREKHEEDYTHYDLDIPEKEDMKDDGWTIVEKKQRMELTTEEKIAKLDLELEQEEKQKEEETSVWDAAEWEYRKRRKYA